MYIVNYTQAQINITQNMTIIIKLDQSIKKL